jgi:voltage-gated potassium channel
MTPQAWTHAALTGDGEPPLSAQLVLAFVLMSIVVVALDGMAVTVPGLDPAVRAVLPRLESAVFAIFTVEYAARLWSAPEMWPDIAPSAARFAYVRSPLGVTDLAVAAAFWLDLALGWGESARAAIALLPLLKLARFLPGLGLVARVFRNERRALGAAFGTLIVLVVLAAGAMYLIEHDAQPQAFGSIPQALWWAIVTMATVGYGDVVPVTVFGKLFGSAVMLVGIAMVAVPAGIMATGFIEELRKRQFIVTWQAVATLPLFASLDAGQIAAVARLLRPQIVPANSVIVRRGEAADAMYFILDGQVEVEVLPKPVRLGAGQYFGEIALIRDTHRTATVMSVDSCQLLALDVRDFRRMLDDHPSLREELARVADQRAAQRPEPFSPTE